MCHVACGVLQKPQRSARAIAPVEGVAEIDQTRLHPVVASPVVVITPVITEAHADVTSPLSVERTRSYDATQDDAIRPHIIRAASGSRSTNTRSAANNTAPGTRTSIVTAFVTPPLGRPASNSSVYDVMTVHDVPKEDVVTEYAAYHTPPLVASPISEI